MKDTRFGSPVSASWNARGVVDARLRGLLRLRDNAHAVMRMVWLWRTHRAYDELDRDARTVLVDERAFVRRPAPPRP
jgi:hypothetical protein